MAKTTTKATAAQVAKVWAFLEAQFAASQSYWTSAGMLAQDIPNLDIPVLKAALQVLTRQGLLACEPHEDGDIYRRGAPVTEKLTEALRLRSEGEMRLNWLALADQDSLYLADGHPILEARIPALIREGWPSLGRQARLAVLLMV